MRDRIAVSMIAGDDWRSDEIKTLLASLEPHCHGLYVNWNGEKRKPRWGNWTSIPIHYITSPWTDDFAAARNAAYRAIPKDKYDWWMWVDTDDFLVAPEGFAPILDGLDPYVQGVFVRYAYAVEPETGKCVVEQWRERLMSLNWVWQWKWPIHEVCAAPQGTQFEWADGELGEKVYIQHQRKSGEERGARERNRRIIMKALREYPHEPKFAYYFAREALAEAQLSPTNTPMRESLCEAAILAYKKFLGMGMSANDDVYLASVSIGDLFAMKGDYPGAVDAYLQATRIYPSWPNAWVGCAKALLLLEDWDRLETFSDIAVNLAAPKTSAAVETMDYDFTPVFLRGIAREQQNNLGGALADYRTARKIFNDPDSKLDARIRSVRKRLKAEKVDLQAIRKKSRGTRAEKSICFYTNPIAEVWNQETLRAGGHGGSETMVLELAPMFAADGWRVAVFGCPGDQRGVGADGVEYWNSEDWNAAEPFSVFISSRAMTALVSPVKTKAKLLWMHDVNLGPSLRPAAGNADLIIPVSDWHAQHLQQLYGIPSSHMHVIPNGIDLSMYDSDRPHEDGHRFVWSSSPDRGLEHLLALWPLIRERWPDATLDVFYGWDFIDKLIQNMPNSAMEYFKMQVGIHWENIGGAEAGLTWHGRQPPATLAAQQLKSDIWAYPTGFMETFCLTAIQAQAAGVLPVTTSLAGLNENVVCDYLKIGGWAGNTDYQNRFLKLLEELLADTEPAADLRAQSRRVGRAFAEQFSIEAAYAKWNELFREMGVR